MGITFKKFSLVAATIGMASLLVITGCSGSSTNTETSTTPTSAQSISLDGAGATFPNPLYTKWFAEYNKLTGVKVNYQAVGSGAGITAITNGTVNFGASDGILTTAQLQKAEAASGPLLTIPMTSGSVAVVYNISGVSSGQLKLSGEVLANIFLGNITKWNDPTVTALNSGINLPNADITVAHRSDGSGTTNIFTNYLDKISPEWHSKVGTANAVDWPAGLGGNGNAGVAGIVQQTPNSIGYVELAYALQNNLPYAQLKNASGNFVAPSIESTTAAANGVTLPDDMRVMITDSGEATAYPICGFTWILVYANQTDQAEGTALANMLWWAIHDGQQYSAGLDYAPLSSAAAAKAEALVKTIKYQGESIVK